MVSVAANTGADPVRLRLRDRIIANRGKGLSIATSFIYLNPIHFDRQKKSPVCIC